MAETVALSAPEGTALASQVSGSFQLPVMIEIKIPGSEVTTLMSSNAAGGLKMSNPSLFH